MSSSFWELAVAVLVAAVGSNGLWAFISTRQQRKSAQTRMLLGLSHDKIIDLCTHYIARGGCTAQEIDDLLKYHFIPYRDAGGNGTAELAVDKVKAMPLITSAEAEKREVALNSKAERWW